VATLEPDNSPGNTMNIAFDFSTQGYTSGNGMQIELFIPTAFQLDTSTVIGTR